MKLLKTTLYTFLITATLLSCQKDNEVTSGDITNNTAPSAEIVFKSADSASVSVMLNYSDKETDLGDLSSQITVEHINSGTTIYTKPITNTGNLKLDDLEAETNYKIYLKVSDGDLETSTDIICSTKKEADPEPVLTYDVQTTLSPNGETYIDSVNAAPLEDGTEIFSGTITTELTSDGDVVDFDPVLHKIELILGETDANKFDVVVNGNTFKLLLNADYHTDNPTTKVTVADVADGLKVSIKAKLINIADGAELASGDVDVATKNVEDTGNSKVWGTGIENGNGHLKDEYLTSYALMQNSLNSTSYNQTMISETALADTSLFEAGANALGYPHLEIKDGMHAGKYLDLGQLGKIKKALILTAAADGLNLETFSPNNFTIIGESLAKALTQTPELFSDYYSGSDGTTVFLTNLEDKQMLAGVCGVNIFE